jgi:hypothetical protein
MKRWKAGSRGDARRGDRCATGRLDGQVGGSTVTASRGIGITGKRKPKGARKNYLKITDSPGFSGKISTC